MSPSISFLRVVRKTRSISTAFTYCYDNVHLSGVSMTKDAIILSFEIYFESLSYFAFLDHAATYNHCENVSRRQSTPRAHLEHVKYQLLDEICTSSFSSFYIVSNYGLSGCVLPKFAARQDQNHELLL